MEVRPLWLFFFNRSLEGLFCMTPLSCLWESAFFDVFSVFFMLSESSLELLLLEDLEDGRDFEC